MNCECGASKVKDSTHAHWCPAKGITKDPVTGIIRGPSTVLKPAPNISLVGPDFEYPHWDDASDGTKAGMTVEEYNRCFPRQKPKESGETYEQYCKRHGLQEAEEVINRELDKIAPKTLKDSYSYYEIHGSGTIGRLEEIQNLAAKEGRIVQRDQCRGLYDVLSERETRIVTNALFAVVTIDSPIWKDFNVAFMERFPERRNDGMAFMLKPEEVCWRYYWTVEEIHRRLK